MGPKYKIIHEVLYRLSTGSNLDSHTLSIAFKSILACPDAGMRDIFLGSLLTGLMVRGSTIQEISGLLDVALSIDGYSPRSGIDVSLPKGEPLICVVGSGKKGIKTINVSTASAIVAASLGVYIVKPNSVGTSSRSGSGDFLREIGVNMEISLGELTSILKTTHFATFSIETFVPCFDMLYGGKFHVPHILSFALAALVNPFNYDTVLYGLSHPNIQLSIETLRKFRIPNAMVISCTYDGIHYIDEFGPFGITNIVRMVDGKIDIPYEVSPARFLGESIYNPQDIEPGITKKENIKLTIDALKGVGKSGYKDMICINSSVLLWLSGKTENITAGFELSRNAIESGLAFDKLVEIIKLSNGDIKRLLAFV